MKTNEWLNMIKRIIIELNSLEKMKKDIMKMNKKYSNSMGIDESLDIFDQIEEREKIESFDVIGYAASNHRNIKLEEIRQRETFLRNQLLAIKCVALSKATKLSKEAKKNGFLNNKAYYEALVSASGFTEDQLVSMLVNDDYVWSFDMVDMSARTGDIISRKGK